MSSPRDLERLWRKPQPALMGIVNCTPDSFFPPSRVEAESAIERSLELLEAGADLIDIGAESTRPGARPVEPSEQLDRLLPVLEGLRAAAPDALISVDTRRIGVALKVIAAGCDLINDISAGSEPATLEAVAAAEIGICLMHMRGTPATMQADTQYEDLVTEVQDFLYERSASARTAGIPKRRIWLDPGIGFGKDLEGNRTLLRSLPRLAALGHPVLLGASRKSFIADLTGAGLEDRLPGSLAALLGTFDLDRAVVRVHDVAATRQFLDVAQWIGS